MTLAIVSSDSELYSRERDAAALMQEILFQADHLRPFLNARVDNALLASLATRLNAGGINARTRGGELMCALALPQLTRFSA